LIGAFCSDLWSRLCGPLSDLTQLPPPNADMLKLFALSHAGYLTFKTVSHTDSTNQ